MSIYDLASKQPHSQTSVDWKYDRRGPVHFYFRWLKTCMDWLFSTWSTQPNREMFCSYFTPRCVRTFVLIIVKLLFVVWCKKLVGGRLGFKSLLWQMGRILGIQVNTDHTTKLLVTTMTILHRRKFLIFSTNCNIIYNILKGLRYGHINFITI